MCLKSNSLKFENHTMKQIRQDRAKNNTTDTASNKWPKIIKISGDNVMFPHQ